MVVWVWMKNKKNRRPWKKKNNGKRKNRMKKKKGARLHEKLWEERDCIFLFYYYNNTCECYGATQCIGNGPSQLNVLETDPPNFK